MPPCSEVVDMGVLESVVFVEEVGFDGGFGVTVPDAVGVSRGSAEERMVA